MNQLTDAMIERALNNTVYMTESPWIIIAIIGAVVLFLLFIFFKSNNARQKIGSGLLVVMFVVMGIGIIGKNASMKHSIQRGEWIVRTDIVDRVMEETHSNGNKDYFMVLKKYGRVSLDSYFDAMQYYPGAEVYVVVVPKDGEYERTGIAYPTDTYVYVGIH